LNEYYDERAPEYDDIYLGRSPGVPEPEAYRQDVEAVKKICSDFGRGHLIDIGCGTGYWLPYYAANCMEITLVDQSRSMLIECQKKAKESLESEKVHFVKGDFFTIRFLSKIFDCAVIAFLISHLAEDDESIFFKKLKMIMKSEADVLWIDSSWSQLRSKYRDKEGYQKRVLRDGRSFSIFKRYFEESDVQAVLRKHSLRLRSLYMGDVFFAANAALRH
jgi:ubiquinone/menaquinone biosynthesis C-methylase UbiE